MKFNTAYSPGKSVAEPTCPKVRVRPLLNKVTHKIEFSDKEPFYEQIQSYKESSSLGSILNRAVMGDSSALSARSGQFVDITNCPNSFAEMFEAGQKAEHLFTSLPEDIRARFGNNQALFTACVLNGSAEQIIRAPGLRPTPAGAESKPGAEQKAD